ncbi:MAG: glycosyltransferase family 4 protein, partial [Candidatus Binataceae bacterium]
MLVERYNALGGIAEFVDSIASELNQLGHQVGVISTFDRAARERGYQRTPRAGAIECTYFEIPSARPFTLRHLERFIRPSCYTGSRRFLRLLSNWQADVVNSHLDTWDRYPTATGACRRAGVPLVQTFHVSDERGRGRLGEKGLLALADADALVACSAAVRDFFAQFVPEARAAHVIFGGVDAAAACPPEPYRRARPFILSAGRLALEHKAFDVLVEAFALLAAEFPEVDLLIAGGGPDHERIERLIAAARLRDRVLLAGAIPRDELRRYYAGARLFALASRPGEGLPLVYLEAMA